MPKGLFDLIVSSYTLNVIDSGEGRRVLEEISRRLTKRGRALVAVRRDTCR
jgi:ubiquinone/menaquinone biosynthesis C-methylase UbiE